MSVLATNAITDASGGNTATINSFTPTVSNMAGRNLIINGAMQVAQRGTSFSGTCETAAYDLDRFHIFSTSGATADCTRTQEEDAPDNTGLRYSYKITPNATNTPTDSGNFAFIQTLEGYTAQPLGHGSTDAPQATLSFWVKSNKTGTYGLQIKEEYTNEVLEQYLLFAYTIDSADAWEYKTITWTGNSNNTLNKTNGSGIRLIWHLDVGPDDETSPSTTWTSDTAFKSVTGQSHLLDSTDNYWQITGVQLEVGTVATPFEHRLYGQELALCQRYYYRTADDGSLTNLMTIPVETSISGAGGFQHPVSMRSVPTITIGSGIRFYSAASGIRTPTISSNRSSTTTFAADFSFSGATAGQAGTIYRGATSGFVEASAEL